MYNSIWFDNLTKPVLNPPAEIFSPIWIILYCTILVALILYTVRITKQNKLRGYIYFIIQMILNLAWSPVFFGAHKIGYALVIILLMDIFVFLTVMKFFQVSKLSGIILIPYFLWILFATYLNFQFFMLN